MVAQGIIRKGEKWEWEQKEMDTYIHINQPSKEKV